LAGLRAKLSEDLQPHLSEGFCSSVRTSRWDLLCSVVERDRHNLLLRMIIPCKNCASRYSTALSLHRQSLRSEAAPDFEPFLIYFINWKAQTRKSTGRANIKQSFTANTERLRKGIICRRYPMERAIRRWGPGRRRTRSSSCFQASVHSSENGRPDVFSGLFAVDPSFGVFISSINRPENLENAEKPMTLLAMKRI
jgi:hypothetical protein